MIADERGWVSRSLPMGCLNSPRVAAARQREVMFCFAVLSAFIRVHLWFLEKSSSAGAAYV
ncbi:MAG: hypothetical protein ACXIUM_09535 [Wenzhouxiangella sp.]